MSIVAQRLRMARERKNLKQTQVKAKTGINNKTLSGYENGVSEPDIETLRTLAKLYDVSLDWLSGEDVKLSKGITEQIISEIVKKYPVDLTIEENRRRLEDIIRLVYSDYKSSDK